jgi:hypothetical protein
MEEQSNRKLFNDRIDVESDEVDDLMDSILEQQIR